MELAVRNELAIKTRIAEKEQILKNEMVLSKLHKTELMVASLSLSTPISQYSESELVETVGKVAKGIIIDIGIKSTDLKYEVYRFLEILKKYYSGLTITEVKTAFELAMVGALDEYLPKDKHGNADRNHYQSFSLDYITKILKAFEAYKNKVWFKAVKSLPEPERVFSEEEKAEAMEGVKQDILEKFEQFKNEGILSDFLAPSLVVNVLHEKGIITEICPVSESDVHKSLYVVMNSKTLNDFEKNEIRKVFESGKIHSRHNVDAERLRDLKLIREAFEKNEKIEL